MPFRFLRALALLPLVAAALSACAVGPDYKQPDTPISAQFKEAEGFSPAAPADTLDRGDWWTLFGDPTLNGLAARVQVSNQNIVAAEAAYRQARELVREQRAGLFPTIDLTGGASRSKGSGASTTTGATTSSGGARSSYRVDIGASWEPDIWGRIRRQIEIARANAQISEADLAAAALAAQGELAADYFGLRQTDVETALDQATVAAYERSLQITQNRYNAGVAPRSDVLQAQTQLDNARADLLDLQQQRANYEHAIAILVGEAPANLTLAPVANWAPTLVQVPVSLPSTLLQRRPDIAAAERQVATANAQIGIERSAYFPDLSLSGSYGFAASQVGSLFSASNSAWSLGLSAAEILFDAGARRARVAASRAAYDQAVAQYRQTVLEALQDVEDQLVTTRVLGEQYELRRSASSAADQAEQIVNNRYLAGQVSIIEVLAAQTAAYDARTALARAAAQRQTTAVALIQSLGGGWRGLGANASPAPRTER